MLHAVPLPWPALVQVGFVLPLFWLVGMLLPLCGRRKSRNDRNAAIASAVCLAVYVVLLAVGVALSLRLGTSAAGRE